MKAVVTRVSSASVTIDGVVEGAIAKGYLVLLGVGPNDTEAVWDKLAEKICCENIKTLIGDTLWK